MFCIRNYIPCIYLLNKIDQISIEELDIITKVSKYGPIIVLVLAIILLEYHTPFDLATGMPQGELGVLFDAYSG